MHPQLTAVVDELREALGRLHTLAADVPPERWAERPDPDRWSAGECVAHLNLTTEAYLPVLREALAEARALGKPAPRRYRRDPVGWLLWATMGPPVRVRTKTPARFVPSGARPAAELLGDFERLQAVLIDVVREADGLPLQEVRIVSPFDPRGRYNVYSALTILPRHQHRHLWQAEQVARAADTR